MTNDDNINTKLWKFWELEEFNPALKITEEEQRCKDHFDGTTTPDENGRFVEAMPFQSASEKNLWKVCLKPYSAPDSLNPS